MGEQIYGILQESAEGTHPVGQMGRHVTTAFLCCSRPEAWEYMEKMLLAAQRQEGLRQTILETVDMAHPEAFVRMVRLILEHDLVRFSSVVRAADVWFGLNWDAASGGKIREVLEKELVYLTDQGSRDRALEGSGTAEEAYLALWACAFYDVS